MASGRSETATLTMAMTSFTYYLLNCTAIDCCPIQTQQWRQASVLAPFIQKQFSKGPLL